MSRRHRPVDPRFARAREPILSSAAVATALRVHGIDDEVRAGRLLTEWAELVGSRIAQRTRPDGIIDGASGRVLVIEVATSPWLHELNLLRAQLSQNLAERLGPPTLFDEIKLRLAGRSRRPPVTLRPPARAVPPPPPLPPPATGAARERIVREVERVDDEELRELIARVRITHDR